MTWASSKGYNDRIVCFVDGGLSIEMDEESWRKVQIY
jgi:hypothetical protein